MKFLVKHLYNGLTEYDVLRVQPKKGIIYKGKVLQKKEIHKMVSDAREFKNSVIWRMIKEDATFEAQNKIFRKSDNLNDIYAGKLMLYSIDVLDKTIKKISDI